eukprot:TRINITY_DN3617_c0_g1_i1.p1 TRINITY_DN3617_c0_g1~~TRINITY_DN3617_c0_g1_i1.p1  ORF type:complete len:528 (+),score=77.10 TRINITY_DN3617_c0_g1_i1:107-1585(+)
MSMLAAPLSSSLHSLTSVTFSERLQSVLSRNKVTYYSKVNLLDQSSSHGKLTFYAPNCSKGVVTSPSLGQSYMNTNSDLELVDVDYYGIGYVRGVRVHGLEFKQGPDGIGVYTAKDIPSLRNPRTIIEVPINLLLTVSKKPPWMFFPDIVPIGHPIFEVIDSTNPETDWDLRLACLLLLALDKSDNFWQFYSDFLPDSQECTSLLLATKEELLELQDKNLASLVEKEQQRVREFWTKHWCTEIPLKLRRLARDVDRFLWAVSIAQTRCTTTTMQIGAKVQEANMLIPYADMLNHSFEPTCSYQWRAKDLTLEVVIDAEQSIMAGSELTTSYFEGVPNDVLMARYGFSSPLNPWEVLNFSTKAKIHLDSFLSTFNITGFPEQYYINDMRTVEHGNFTEGAIIAAARTLPTWSEGDLPYLPKGEIKAAKALQLECCKMLESFPTSIDEDVTILESGLNGRSKIYEEIIRYRLHRKQFIDTINEALSIYSDSILF